MNNRNEYVIAVITKTLIAVLGFFESILLARFLGNELKGQVTYISSIAQMGFLMASFGIYAAYPYYRKKYGKDIILDRVISVTICMLAFYCVICTILALLLYKISIIWFYIVLIIPLLFYDKVISFVWMIEMPNERNIFILLVSFIKLFYFLLLFFMADRLLVFGVSTLVFEAVIDSIYFTVKLPFHFSIRHMTIREIVPLAKYGFLPMVTVLMTTINYRIDIIMLKQFNFIDFSSIGVYSIGIMLAEKVLLVPDSAKEILLSRLAKGKTEEEVAKVMRFCFAISLFLAVFVSLISRVFISFVYGEEYMGAEVVTNISVWGTVFMVFFKMISQYNVVNRKQIYNVAFLSVAIIINIILNLLLIPIYGINGAAMTTAIGYMISSGMFLIYFHRKSGIAYRRLMVLDANDIAILKRK